MTLAAIGEIVNDKLSTTPSRKTPLQFAARIVSGSLCGAAIGAQAGSWPGGLVLGAAGAVIGALGGAAARGNLARAFANDRPAALIEDIVAIAAAALVARSL